MPRYTRVADGADVDAVQYDGSPASVREVMVLLGAQTCVLNTETGLMIGEQLYRRWTWFVKSTRSIVAVAPKAFAVEYTK